MLAAMRVAVNGEGGPHLRQDIGGNGFERPVGQEVSRQLPLHGVISGIAGLVDPLDGACREIKPRAFDAAAALVRPDPAGGDVVGHASDTLRSLLDAAMLDCFTV